MRRSGLYLLLILLLAVLVAWPAYLMRSKIAQSTNNDAKLRERAMKLHRDAIVVDTHNDITSAITDQGFDLGARDTSGKNQTDIPRMKEGGLDAEFFAIYVAVKYAKDGGAARRAMEMIDGVYEHVPRHPDPLAMAFTVGDIRRIHQS